jgi:hypothetical protein
MNKKKIYIGVSGLARTGKNLFCDIAVKQLKEKYNLTAKTFALAYELKNDCREFVWNKLGIDVFTEKTEEKNVIRPLLVWYGGVKRKQTSGKYWTNLLKSRLDEDTSEVNLISDIRYCEYTNDEVQWIQNKLEGNLIHISKYTYGFPTNGRHIKVKNDKTKKIFTDPPNSEEATNDPKVKMFADYKIEWEDVGGTNLINNEYLNEQVKLALETILK